MKYEEAAKIWGAGKLGRSGIAYDVVRSVSFDAYTSVDYCPTCGPETEYEATVYYTTPEGLNSCKDFSFHGMTEILQELFEISES